MKKFIWREQLYRNIFRDEKGLATIQYMLVIVVITLFMFFVFTQVVAINTQAKVKNAVNRAVKAAALTYSDETVKIDGQIIIDPADAKDRFQDIMEKNLKNVRGWSLQTLEVVDHSAYTFPYTVNNTTYNFQHTFEYPGVWAIVRTTIPKYGGGEITIETPAVAEVKLQIDP